MQGVCAKLKQHPYLFNVKNIKKIIEMKMKWYEGPKNLVILFTMKAGALEHIVTTG